jgi:hypothetical protein
MNSKTPKRVVNSTREVKLSQEHVKMLIVSSLRANQIASLVIQTVLMALAKMEIASQAMKDALIGLSQKVLKLALQEIKPVDLLTSMTELTANNANQVTRTVLIALTQQLKPLKVVAEDQV